MEEIHIGNEIRSVFNERGLSISEFSRRIKTSRENVYSIFNRKTIDTGLLITISNVLDFDFFSIYVSFINPTKDPEIDHLRKENALLKEINELLKSKEGK
jgi:transcriptional regulator with XRE-family HTH domain